MAHQLMIEQRGFFSGSAADIVEDQRGAMGRATVRDDADMGELATDQGGENIARRPVLRVAGQGSPCAGAGEEGFEVWHTAVGYA